MAKRFHSYFTNYRNVRYDIEIHDADFVGASTVFDTAEGGFLLSYSGDSQRRTGRVLATDCEVVMMVANSGMEALVTDVAGSKEGRFTLRITTGVGSPTLFWAGLILADVGSYDERYYPFPFRIRATDGIGSLRDVEYKDGANYYTGKASLKDHLINALSRLGYVSTHYASGETFLKIMVDWWEETMTNNTTNDPMALTYVDHAAFYVFKKGVRTAKTCWEVVEQIMRVMGARISNHDGGFWVEQITYRTAATVVIRSYDLDGVYISSNNYSTLNTINQTAAGALGAVASYEFFGALSKVVHIFEATLRRNFMDGVVITDTSALETYYFPVHANGGSTTMRMTGLMSLSVGNVSFSGNLTQPRHAIFECYLKVGSYYLHNTYSTQNYQVIFTPASWETSLSHFYLAVWMPSGIPGGPIAVTYTTQADIWMPALPQGADSYDIDMNLIAVTGVGSLAQLDLSFEFLEPRLEFYSYGSPALSDDEWEYLATNSDAGNSLVEESSCILGNSTDPNAVGALWVKPSSTYVLAGNWGDGTDTPNVRLEVLLTGLTLGGQLTPIRRLSGTLRGTIAPLARTSWDGATWLLLGGSWNAGLGELTGEWWELSYGTGLSTSGPIKKKIKKVDNPVPPIDGGGDGSGLQGFKLHSTPPGTMLYAVAATRSLDALSAGAVTTIDVTDTLAAGDFYDGDTVVILNPITGQFDELEVTVTSAGGDDFITLTGTLSADYPPDSPIIKKPLIGHPQVFGSGAANRLTYWVSANELAAMAAGTDGWPLVSNGASLAAFEQLTTTGIADDAVTFAKMQNIATSKLLGRYSAGSGDVQEITISTGLALDGSGNLTATSGSGTVTSVALTMPTGFSVGGSPVTTSGTLAVTTSLNGPLRGDGSGFTTGNTNLASEVTGTLPVGNGGTGLSALGTALQLIRVNAGATALEYFTHSFLTANQTITLSGDVSGSGSTAITVTIGANVVTDAKFRQSAGLSVVGRSANSTGDVADIVAGSDFQVLRRSGTAVGFGSLNLASTNAVTGTLPVGNGGTGAATLANDSVLTGNGTSAIVAETNLTFNSAGQLTVGSGTAVAFLNVFTGALSGTQEFIRMSGNISGNMVMSHLNANNATTGANSIYQISVGGASAGDAIVQFTVSGVVTHAIGVDNSDADKFKITPGAAAPGGTANRGLCVTNAATALVGVNNDNPAHPLDVTGRARATTFLNVQQNPSISAFGTGAGTGPTLNFLTGGNNEFTLSFTTGTSPVNNGVLFTITLTTGFSSQIVPVHAPRNAAAASEYAKFYYSTVGPSSFQMSANGTLTASTTYQLNFIVFGH